MSTNIDTGNMVKNKVNIKRSNAGKNISYEKSVPLENHKRKIDTTLWINENEVHKIDKLRIELKDNTYDHVKLFIRDETMWEYEIHFSSSSKLQYYPMKRGDTLIFDLIKLEDRRVNVGIVSK